jgi:hypothetical protein
MNIRSEPKVRPVLDPREPACSLKRKMKQGYEILKEEGQFQIPGVEESRIFIIRSPRIMKCETPKS